MWDLLGLVAATGVLSAAWTTLWTWVAEGRQRKANARYVAMRAAISLEDYAIRCWQLLYSGPEHLKQTGSPMAQDVPELESMPDSADWVNVDPTLANEALSFSNSVSIVQIIVAHARHLENNPFDAETYAKERGQAAWAIAERLRRKYGLDDRADQRKQLAELLI
ncbi:MULTISPECIES: hypothetical protein [unclassified Mesorhizobium]|uniref:hypothetical protein n=1 Tax=unclassified Mesorhizobium TaxID=325217 RepID=UPI000F759420|nr:MULTISPECIES: hypothetical protein [unclassified Mesorhizobium]AZO54751.1 hypothetical protein EJ077_15760 [Mesorhizobium sp. M8A.F.Ca.ET.057.01.1.1]RWE44328.1 MAG: hypothetical protein EOS80_20580 [Mesorhizobium sp.]TJX77844.1 MAG: hypothetical protein E5W21_02915 [Mesorhizobium sp.]